MDMKQMKCMHTGKGFVAALDQSGGSTPKALAQYGIQENEYSGEKEMFDLVHAMRSRIIASKAFTSEHILGVILFEGTMLKEIEGVPVPDYLWQRKGIVPFLKIDVGLEPEKDGVQMMKRIPDLEKRLADAKKRNIFGTKMRSVIHKANAESIAAVVRQQFEFARIIVGAGLVPIIEPEVDIKSPDKAESESILKSEIEKCLAESGEDFRAMLKLSLPTQDDFYRDVVALPQIIRVVALSGGYSRDEADARLARNHGVIASFSRALLEGLSAKQADVEFDRVLGESIGEIYQASIT